MKTIKAINLLYMVATKEYDKLPKIVKHYSSNYAYTFDDTLGDYINSDGLLFDFIVKHGSYSDEIEIKDKLCCDYCDELIDDDIVYNINLYFNYNDASFPYNNDETIKLNCHKKCLNNILNRIINDKGYCYYKQILNSVNFSINITKEKD